MLPCFAKLRQHLRNLFASWASWASDPASPCQNCRSATALISLMLFLHMLCFSLENLNWLFCISKVNATSIYAPQYPKALMEELPKPQNEISRAKTEESRACLPSYWPLTCLLNQARGEATLLPLRVVTLIAMAPENAWFVSRRTRLPTFDVVLLPNEDKLLHQLWLRNNVELLSENRTFFLHFLGHLRCISAVLTPHLNNIACCVLVPV